LKGLSNNNDKGKSLPN